LPDKSKKPTFKQLVHNFKDESGPTTAANASGTVHGDWPKETALLSGAHPLTRAGAAPVVAAAALSCCATKVKSSLPAAACCCHVK
jgi:hypothetical protein